MSDDDKLSGKIIKKHGEFYARAAEGKLKDKLFHLKDQSKGQELLFKSVKFHINENDEAMEIEVLATASEEPDDEDIFFTPTGPLGSKTSLSAGGKHVGTYDDDEEALKAAKDWMKKNQFYPNMWQVSDHGNHHLIKAESLPELKVVDKKAGHWMAEYKGHEISVWEQPHGGFKAFSKGETLVGKSPSPQDALEQACEKIDEGKVKANLDRLVACMVEAGIEPNEHGQISRADLNKLLKVVKAADMNWLVEPEEYKALNDAGDKFKSLLEKAVQSASQKDKDVTALYGKFEGAWDDLMGKLGDGHY